MRMYRVKIKVSYKEAHFVFKDSSTAVSFMEIAAAHADAGDSDADKIESISLEIENFQDEDLKAEDFVKEDDF